MLKRRLNSELFASVRYSTHKYTREDYSGTMYEIRIESPDRRSDSHTVAVWEFVETDDNSDSSYWNCIYEWDISLTEWNSSELFDRFESIVGLKHINRENKPEPNNTDYLKLEVNDGVLSKNPADA